MTTGSAPRPPRSGGRFASAATVLARRLKSDYSRLALFSSGAVLVAYFIADVTPFADPTVAALTALVSVRPTFHETAGETVRQVIGTFFGALLGIAVTFLFGSNALLLAAVILSGFMVARVLRLGEGGAIALGVTVILVLLQLDKLSVVEDRVVGVAIGAVVALVFSLWVRPGMPHHRALAASLQQVDRSSDLLLEISEHLARHNGTVSLAAADGWVERAEANMRAVARTRLEAEGAARSAKWSPLVDQKEAEAVVEQIRLAVVTARTVYTMTTHLRVAALNGDRLLNTSMTLNVADVLAATANVISDQAQLAQENPAESLTDTAGPAQELATFSEAVLADIRLSEDTQPNLLAGTILRDAAIITDGLIGEQDPPVVAKAKPARRSKRLDPPTAG